MRPCLLNESSRRPVGAPSDFVRQETGTRGGPSRSWSAMICCRRAAREDQAALRRFGLDDTRRPAICVPTRGSAHRRRARRDRASARSASAWPPEIRLARGQSRSV